MIKASRKAEPDRLAREVRCVDAVDAMLRKALAADEAEGSSRTDGRVRVERVYEVPYIIIYVRASSYMRGLDVYEMRFEGCRDTRYVVA